MDKKIINLIIAALVLVVVLLLLVVWKLCGIKPEAVTKPAVPTEGEELQAQPIEDPVGEDGMKIHNSENGYSVKYPDSMTAKSMAKSIDFILEDDESGSSLNIVTAKNDGSVKKLTREEFEASLEQSSGNTELIGYDDVMLNGAEAVVAEYIYIDARVKQYIIITESYAYNITVMESPYITEEMSEVFKGVTESFVLN